MWQRHEKNVCLSVRLSVKHVNCDKTKETYARILIPYEKNDYPSFLTQRMVDGGDPLHLKFKAQLTLFEQKRPSTVDIHWLFIPVSLT